MPEGEGKINPSPEPGPPEPAPEQHYERTAPVREWLKEFRQAREALAAAEKEKNKNPEAYEGTKAAYESKRAEYVGASVNRMLKERERMTELEVEANPRKVGWLEKQWRAWGEYSLVPKSWRESFDRTAFGRTRIGQIFIRSLNMRTALSLSLLGVAWGSGFGTVVGIGTLMARSGVGAAGTYFGSQAFMEGLAQKRRFTVDQKKLQEIASFDLNDVSEEAKQQKYEHMVFLEREMARLEAASLLAGRKIGQAKEYREVRRIYQKYGRTFREETPEGFRPTFDTGWVMNRLEARVEFWEEEYKRFTRARKVIAGGLAAMFPITRLMALTWDEIAAVEGRPKRVRAPVVLELQPLPPAAMESLPPLPAVPPLETGPRAPAEALPTETTRLSPETMAKIQEMTGVKPPAPPEAVPLPGATIRLSPETMAEIRTRTGASPLAGPEVASRAAAGVEAPVGTETVKLGPEAAELLKGVGVALKAAAPEALAAVEKALGPMATVEAGGNIWRAALRLLESGEISKADFNKAWANSFVDIEGQGKVPLHKIGVVHAGDKIRFIPAEGGNPPRFEIIPAKAMPIGSDQDLYARYEKLGKEPPEWLKKSVGAPLTPAEVMDSVTPSRGGLAEDFADTEGETEAAEEYEEPGAEAEEEEDESAKGAGDTTGVKEPAAERPSVPELDDAARAELERALAHFNSADLTDQEAMIAALGERAGSSPLAQELLGKLIENPKFRANSEAYFRLLNRLNVVGLYSKIRGMSLGQILERAEAVEADLTTAHLTEATAAIDETSRGALRVAKLIRMVSPGYSAHLMRVDEFLKAAPQRHLELMAELPSQLYK